MADFDLAAGHRTTLARKVGFLPPSGADFVRLVFYFCSRPPTRSRLSYPAILSAARGAFSCLRTQLKNDSTNGSEMGR